MNAQFIYAVLETLDAKDIHMQKKGTTYAQHSQMVVSFPVAGYCITAENT